MSDEALLIRFRPKDSKEGVSRATMKAIAEALDLSETAAVHRALVELAQRYVPQYPRDNGTVTDQQHRAIAQAVRGKHGKAVITEMLFAAPSPAPKVKPSGSKRVSASRAR
jgi:hypothetical protein